MSIACDFCNISGRSCQNDVKQNINRTKPLYFGTYEVALNWKSGFFLHRWLKIQWILYWQTQTINHHVTYCFIL